MATVDTGDGYIYYETIEMTPPWRVAPDTIVFHHGVGIDRRIWAEWLPVLAERYRIVWFDLRGYGRSHVPEDGYAWTMETLAADALAVADAAGCERFHFVGESLGGAMALYLAIHHAERLLSITPCTSPNRGGTVQWLVEWRDYITEHGMVGWSKRMMERRFPPGILSQDRWDWFHAVQSACAAESVLGLGDMLTGLDLTADLPSIALPTLLIAADRSPVLPLSVALEIRDAVPDSELRVIAGARHGIVYSHARDCALTLRNFLGRHEAA